MASDFIVEVSEADFEREVLVYSQQVPVVVDFWAEWCNPCKMLGPMLERLTQEAQGSFRLAKVDVDENQNLAIRYGIHGIPAVKAFRNGAMVAEFTGVQPEPRVREFLNALNPTQADLSLEKGNSLLAMGQAEAAEDAFYAALEVAPDHPAGLIGLAKSKLLLGLIVEAHVILERFPASKEYSTAQTLLPLAESLIQLTHGEDFSDENSLDPAFFNSLRLFKRGNIEASLDGLLDVLREDRRYRNGLARQVILGMLEVLGKESPVAVRYRNELGSVLF